MTLKKLKVAAAIHDFIDSRLQEENRKKGRDKDLEQPGRFFHQAQA
jgi:hypothetical protein